MMVRDEPRTDLPSETPIGALRATALALLNQPKALVVVFALPLFLFLAATIGAGPRAEGLGPAHFARLLAMPPLDLLQGVHGAAASGRLWILPIETSLRATLLVWLAGLLSPSPAPKPTLRRRLAVVASGYLCSLATLPVVAYLGVVLLSHLTDSAATLVVITTPLFYWASTAAFGAWILTLPAGRSPRDSLRLLRHLKTWALSAASTALWLFAASLNNGSSAPLYTLAFAILLAQTVLIASFLIGEPGHDRIVFDRRARPVPLSRGGRSRRRLSLRGQPRTGS
jgi:hypothetical protein